MQGVFERVARVLVACTRLQRVQLHPPRGGFGRDAFAAVDRAELQAEFRMARLFGSGIDEETARREDLGTIGLAADYWMNYTEKSVTASCKIRNPNNSTYKTIFRDGIGCTLVEGVTEQELRAQDIGDQTPPPPVSPMTSSRSAPLSRSRTRRL